MTNEFTDYGNLYYRLTQLLARREERLQSLLDNAPLYSGQTRLTEIDAIISYYREAQAAKKETDKTLNDLTKTGCTILMIMEYFEIQPGTVLTGEIPGELEYNIWADDNEAVHIIKTKDLEPEVEDGEFIVIKFSGGN